MRKFLVGVAVFALATGTAAADPGGKGKGGEGGGGRAHVQAAPGGGGGGGGHGKHAQAPRGGGHGDSKASRDGGRKGDAARGGSGAKARSDDRGNGRQADNASRHADKASHRSKDNERAQGSGRGNDRSAAAHEAAPSQRAHARGEPGSNFKDRGARTWRGVERAGGYAANGTGLVRLAGGCPPGLAAKHNGCMPPGLAKPRRGFWSELDRPAWWGLGGLAAGQYLYDDGYLIRYDDDGVEGWLPLLGGALAPGQIWPSSYEPVELPDYYETYYGLGPSYRSYDDVLYRVDPETSAITSVAALLTGDPFAVGQPLPSGYDVYNVPYDYRDEYVDGPEAQYRYSDGYVYQVDPQTQLIAAAIELLT